MGMISQNLNECKIYGIEIDSISGRIARQLYQKNTIAVKGYEEIELPDSFFDIAIGNVPFGNYKVLDKRYDKYNFQIHDYFFAKTLDKVRPNGIIAFITSKGTLDKENENIRKYISQRAELVGVIRLPDNAFKNAGTQVTTDIIFLKKRDKITDIEDDWVQLDSNENGIRMNKYFVAHPEMILGEMKNVTTQYGIDSACKAFEDKKLEDLLNNAIEYINAEIEDYQIDLDLDEKEQSIPATPEVRNFSYTIVDNKIYYRENSQMYLQELPLTTANRIRGMIEIRDCVRNLIDLQMEDYPDENIKREQVKLNGLYDNFSKKYGLINSKGNELAFREDSSYYLLCSLEILDENKNLKRKADMFSKRTIKTHEVVSTVDNSVDALILSISEKACVDMKYMSEKTGKTEQQLVKDLKGSIYKDPIKEEYVTADEYLSGNIREKLRIAERLAENDSQYRENVEALQNVKMKDLSASEISVRLGATWIPVEDIRKFIFDLLQTDKQTQEKINVHYSDYTSQWNTRSSGEDRVNQRATTTYGTKRINAYKIIETTLNLKDVRIFDTIINIDGKEEKVLNAKETAIAQSKQELIKEKFLDWIWKDKKEEKD